MKDPDGNEIIFIRFEDGPLHDQGNMPDLLGAIHTFQVPAAGVGGWPPPKRLAVLIMEESVGLVDVSTLTEERLAEVRAKHGCYFYRRTQMSQLTDDELGGLAVARGAQYALDDELGEIDLLSD